MSHCFLGILELLILQLNLTIIINLGNWWSSSSWWRFRLIHQIIFDWLGVVSNFMFRLRVEFCHRNISDQITFMRLEFVMPHLTREWISEHIIDFLSLFEFVQKLIMSNFGESQNFFFYKSLSFDQILMSEEVLTCLLIELIVKIDHKLLMMSFWTNSKRLRKSMICSEIHSLVKCGITNSSLIKVIWSEIFRWQNSTLNRNIKLLTTPNQSKIIWWISLNLHQEEEDHQLPKLMIIVKFNCKIKSSKIPKKQWDMPLESQVMVENLQGCRDSRKRKFRPKRWVQNKLLRKNKS
jgi:hypothetical protein